MLMEVRDSEMVVSPYTIQWDKITSYQLKQCALPRPILVCRHTERLKVECFSLFKQMHWLFMKNNLGHDKDVERFKVIFIALPYCIKLD